MYIDGQGTTPLVTVIMPAYNVAPFIETAITSVINQTVENWELLVIDDCSKDNSFQIAQEIAKRDSRIKVIQNDSNMGVAKTRNRGIDLAKGQYIAFLDSDDYWYPVFLEKTICCAKESSAGIVYCSYELVDEHNQKVCNDFIVPITTTFEQSIVRSVITCSTVLLSSEIAKNNKFPTDIYHEDIALWFKLLKEEILARGVVEILAAYRQREGSRSSKKISSACRRWVVYRSYLKLPLTKCVITMFRYGYNGLKKFKKM